MVKTINKIYGGIFMKKRICLLLACCMLIGGTLTGCGETYAVEDEAALEIGFKPVPGMDGVVYNVDTKAMFYMFNTAVGYQGYGYFGPYLNENLKPCRYVNGEIVEKED